MVGENKILKKEQFEKYNNDLKNKIRWSGTRAQYDALATKDPYTTYYVTDEQSMFRNGIEYGGGAGKYLPLTGGTLTGNLNMRSNTPTLVFEDTNSVIGQRDDPAKGIKNHLWMNISGIKIQRLVGSGESVGNSEIHLKTDGSTVIRAGDTSGAADVGILALGNDGTLKFNNSDVICKRDVIDNLTSTDADKPLSANQGKILKDLIGSGVIDIVYPIGITFIQRTAADNPNTLFPGTTWTDISSSYNGRYEQINSSKDAGSTIAAGLPNITGQITPLPLVPGNPPTFSGALKAEWPTGAKMYGAGGDYSTIKITIDASKSSSIYGSSTTVTPLTTTVKLWQRTA